jgi:hypothetical protein
VEERTSVVRRGVGRSLLLTGALAAALAGVAACGNGGGDTLKTSATPAGPAESATTPSAEPPAASNPSAPAVTASPTAAASVAAGPIVVQSPTEGATVPRTFTVKGTARTVEGTVLWQLVAADGDAAESGLAEGGADSAQPFQFTVTAPAAGTYTLRVFEESAKDGSAANTVERTLTIG